MSIGICENIMHLLNNSHRDVKDKTTYPSTSRNIKDRTTYPSTSRNVKLALCENGWYFLSHPLFLIYVIFSIRLFWNIKAFSTASIYRYTLGQIRLRMWYVSCPISYGNMTYTKKCYIWKHKSNETTCFHMWKFPFQGCQTQTNTLISWYINLLKPGLDIPHP